LLVAISTSGFAGAAAITTGLSSLGGPLRMIGGIAVLLLVLVSNALASYGFPRMAQAVIQGLIEKGDFLKSIRSKLGSVPKWTISTDLRTKIDEVLNHSPA
jgi:hypothetical protein